MKSPERPRITIGISSDEVSSAGSDILDVWEGERCTTTPASPSQGMSNQGSAGLIPKTAEAAVASACNDTTKLGSQSPMKPGSSEYADGESSGNVQSQQKSHSTADQALHVVQPLVSEIGLVLGGSKSLTSQLSAKLVQSNLDSEEVSRQGLILGNKLRPELLPAKNAEPLTSQVAASGPALKPMPSASSAAWSRQGASSVDVGNKQSSVTNSSSALLAVARKVGAEQIPEGSIILSGPTPKPMPSPVIVSASRHPLPPQGRSTVGMPMASNVPGTTPVMTQARSTTHVGQGQAPSTNTQGIPTWAPVHPHPSHPSTNLGNNMPPPTMHYDATKRLDYPSQPLGTQLSSQTPHTLPPSPGFRTSEEAPQKNAPTAPRSPSAPLRYPTVSLRKPVPDDESAESSSSVCQSPEDKPSHYEATGALVANDIGVKPQCHKDSKSSLERDPQAIATQPQPAPDKESSKQNNNDATLEGLEDAVIEDIYQDTPMLTQDPEFMTTRTKTGSLPRAKKRKACHGKRVIEVSEWNLVCCTNRKQAVMENLRKGVDATVTFQRVEANPWKTSASRKRAAKQAKRSVWVSDAEFDTRCMQYDINARGAMNILVRRPSFLGAGTRPYTEAYLQSLPDPLPHSTSSSRVGRNYQARIPHCDSKLQEWSIDGDDDDTDADEIPW
jgi:hypothetical protein